jgi:hypothetical protein
MPVTSGCIYSNGSVLGTTKVKSYNSLASCNLNIIDAKLMGPNYIDDEGALHYLNLNVGSGQSVQLLTGTPGRRIEVENYSINASGATGFSFLSSGTTITTIGGPFSLAANQQVVDDGKSMRTNFGDALTVNSTASTVTGSVAYRIV